MDIDEWSQDSEAFKTITSGSETRNQTTNKKQYEKHRAQSKKRSQHDDSEISVSKLENLM